MPFRIILAVWRGNTVAFGVRVEACAVVKE